MTTMQTREIQHRAFLLEEDMILLRQSIDGRSVEHVIHRLRDHMKTLAAGVPKTGTVDLAEAKHIRDALAQRLDLLNSLPELPPLQTTKKPQQTDNTDDSGQHEELDRVEGDGLAPDPAHQAQQTDPIQELIHTHHAAINAFDTVIEQLGGD